MITCDVCRKQGAQSESMRYIFPCRRIDVGAPVEVVETYSVDLCHEHARDFWGEFIDLINKYSFYRKPNQPDNLPALPTEEKSRGRKNK